MRKRKRLTYYTKFILLYGLAIFLLVQKGNAQFTVNGKQVTYLDSVVQVCINTPIKFVSTEIGTISWSFVGGSPENVAGSSATTFYINSGTYSAIQTIVTADTSYNFSARIIVNNDYPKANFTVTPPASGCANELFRFKNTSTGNLVSGFWAWGACLGFGGTSTLADVVTNFPSAIGGGITNCSVRLFVTNSSGCSDTATVNFPINQLPDINLTDEAGASIRYEGRLVFKTCGGSLPIQHTFFNQSSTSAADKDFTIKWQNDNVVFGAPTWPAAGVQHSFGEGYTSIIVGATGQNGCRAEKTYYSFVSPQATPNVTLTAPTFGLICAPQSLPFSIGQNNNTPGTTYKLSLNDNSPALVYLQPLPAITPITAINGSCGVESTDGVTKYANALTATVVAQHPCGSASASVLPIYASAKPKAAFTSPVSLCTNTLSLIGSTGNFGSIVSLQNGEATCTYDGKIVWEISPATYTIDSGSLGNANGDYSSIVAWQTGTEVFRIAFTDTGTYTIKQIVGNGSCGVDSIKKTICISTPSVASFTLNTKQGCPGNTVIKTTNTTPAPTGFCAGEFYSWQITPINSPGCQSGSKYELVNNTTGTSKNVEITFEEKGLYEIRLISRLSATSPCFTEFVDTIGIYDKPAATIKVVAQICAGDLFSPTAQTADCLPNKFQTYKWKFFNGTPATATDSVPLGIKYTLPGNTYMTLETTNSCGTDRDTAYILINEKPTLNKISDTTICSNNPISLSLASSSGSNTQYSWTSTIISGTGVAGNTNGTKQSIVSIADRLINVSNATAVVEYKIVAEPTTLPFKCPSDSTVIRVTILPQIQAGQDTLLCLGKTLQLNAIGIGVVKWDWTPSASLTNASIANPTTTAALTTSTTYYVTGTTALGCSNTDSILVNVTPPFVLSVSPKNAFACTDSAVQLQAAGGFTYAWSPGNTLSDPSIANPIAKPDQTTTYTVTSSDQYNCEVKTDIATVIVGGFTNVDLNSSSVRQVIAGTEVPLFASTDSANISRYIWTATPSDGGSLQCQNAAVCSQQLATIYKDVTFSVQVENIYGCKQTDTISFVASCISEKQLFVPTAFSPDGNNLNDVFTILGQGFTINYFRIYNRWGNIVFERKEGGKPNDKAYGWNGKLKDGGMAPSGNYTCIVEVTCTAGGIFSYKGNVTLIR